ncbi:MAG: hypothetical protein ACXABY_24075 [Candidatus Thorarchaeota archaeon]|jgi:tetratricopeptide (TPR) repeat protein
MKPLGTITMYFPFVDEETREVLESTMNEAYNYAAFADALCEKVMSSETSEVLVYLATKHAFNLDEFGLVLHMSERYSHLQLPRVYFLVVKEYLGRAEKSEVIAAANSVLETSPEDWIALDMHHNIWRSSYTAFSFTAESLVVQEDTLRGMDFLLEQNAALDCLASQVLWDYGYVCQTRDRNMEAAIDYYQRAFEKGLHHDEQVMMANAIIQIALTVMMFDTGRALDAVQRASEIWKHLGAANIGYFHGMGLVYATRGEFSAAIEHSLESIRLSEGKGIDLKGTMVVNSLVTYLNMIGKGEDALEWVKICLDHKNPGFQAWAHIRMAWSLINIGRLDEATEWLQKGHQLVLKHGAEMPLLDTYLVTGLLERAHGEIEHAMASFEQAFGHAERINRQSRKNPCLLYLTQSELDLFKVDDENRDADISGPWMARLDEEVREKDIPGIRGLALLLKAELRFKQGRLEEADELMTEVRRLGEQSSMSFLKDKVTELRRHADQRMDA